MDPTARSLLFVLGSITALCGAVLLWAAHTSAESMAFVERYLGFSPDDGDGSLEFILVIAFLMIITTAALSWSFK
jgi:hypothetical protein